MKTIPHFPLFVGLLALLVVPAGSLSAQETLYWYPGAAPNQGGTNTWDTTASRWSITSGVTKTAASLDPQDGDSVVFGGTAGTVTLPSGYSTNSLDDFRVETDNYIFRVGSGGGQTIRLNTFSGPSLAEATFEGTGNVSATFEIGSNTAFNGTFAPGTGTFNFVKTGAGRLDLSSATLNHTGLNTLNGGSLWLSKAQVATPANGGLTGGIRMGSVVNEGGTVTVIGDGGTSTIDRTLAISGILIGATGTAFDGTIGGFGARNGNLNLNFGGAAAAISWGAANFRATTFIMGTTDSTHTVTLSNALTVSQDSRILQVQNGAAAIDAEISGALSTTSSGRILTKEGSGTLLLSGATASSLRLNQAAGTILIDGSWSSTANNTNYGIQVSSGASLGGDGTVTLSAASLDVAGTLMAGRGGADESLTISGNVNLLSDSTLAFGLGSTAADRDFLVRTGGTWVFQTDQQVRLFDMGATETTYTLVTGLSSAVDVGNWQVVNSGPLNGTFSSDASNIYFTLNVIPEPATSLLVVFGLGAAFLRRRRVR